jgi:hypothetical protein
LSSFNAFCNVRKGLLGSSIPARKYLINVKKKNDNNLSIEINLISMDKDL